MTIITTFQLGVVVVFLSVKLRLWPTVPTTNLTSTAGLQPSGHAVKGRQGFLYVALSMLGYVFCKKKFYVESLEDKMSKGRFFFLKHCDPDWKGTSLTVVYFTVKAWGSRYKGHCVQSQQRGRWWWGRKKCAWARLPAGHSQCRHKKMNCVSTLLSL